ncbi:MAG: pilin [Patescibacteria group bacterium]|nr:pilin [Patescibacteria group bacterium]MDW8279709.1 pilin [bacterium]
MKNKKKLISFIAIFILGFFLIANFVLAQGVAGTTGGSNSSSKTKITLLNPLSCDNVGCVLEKIIDAIFKISIPITVLMILIGAFQILTAGGQEEKFKEGKNTIKWAVIGFALVILSQGFVNIILDILGMKK